MRAAILVSLVALVSACGASSAAGDPPHAPSGSAANTGAGSPSRAKNAGKKAGSNGTASPTTVPATTTTTLPRPAPGWTVVSETPAGIVTDTRTVHLPDGTSVTLVRFHAGRFRLDLHLGSVDPPSAGLVIPAAAGYAISQAERPLLLGAFNGGFQVSTGSGGVEVDGQVAVPLVAGDASLVINQNGSVRVGVWGQTVPVPGEKVLSVRQNLTPLISAGQVSPQIANVGAWGAELYGVAATARSAVGTDPAGNLVYAASMGALPSDLAAALQMAGVTNAMELDINPYWVQADVASTPGGTLSAAIPGQQRPADTYLLGWTRDFFAVLAATPKATP